jgi:hypothetical protein
MRAVGVDGLRREHTFDSTIECDAPQAPGESRCGFSVRGLGSGCRDRDRACSGGLARQPAIFADRDEPSSAIALGNDHEHKVAVMPKT